MNARFDLRLDKDAFDRWLLTQERKHEWKEGRVVQMTNVTRGHARIVRNVARALEDRLDPAKWAVVTSDFGVEERGFVRFPDVLVEPEDAGALAERRSSRPVLLVEVLSPSSVAVDMREKPEEYARFASLAAYLVVSQDEAICWLWTRDAATGRLSVDPAEVRGRDQAIEVPGLGLALPLVEVYRGIRTNED